MINQSQVIGEFIKRLIEEKNFQNLEYEVMEQIKSDLTERIEDRINVTILENIPKEKLEEFNAVLDNANSEEIQAFCQNNIANMDEVIAKSLLDFRNTYLNA